MRLLSKLKTIVKTSTQSTTTLTSILKESEAIETAPIFTLADRLPQLPALPNIPRRASAKVRQLLPSVPFVSDTPPLDIS
ncbi:MAG TPA: FAD-containing monooxygenase EthA, partial [Psychrobacter sp.]|nr:FAD-containing monooxygenase EthA [Psychrobacter sp.]